MNMVLQSLKIKTLFILGALLFSTLGTAENITLEHEKAQIVSKLVKYANWPPESRRLKFTIGVFDNPAFHSTLKAYFSDKKIKGKAITVINTVTLEQSKKVNLLYIPFQHRLQLKALAEINRTRHILLVSENNNDVDNMMVNLLYSNDEDDIAFEINKVNINNEKVNLTAWLKTVSDKQVAIKVSKQQTVQQAAKTSIPSVIQVNATSEQILLEAKLTSLNQQVLVQEKRLNSVLQKNKVSKKELNKNQLTSKKLLSKLAKQEQKSSTQDQLIINNQNKLSLLSKQIKEQQEQKNQANNKQQRLNSEELEFQTQQIITLKEQLKKQKKLTKNKKLKQREILKKPLEQPDVGVLFYVVLTIALIALLIVTFLVVRYKKTLTSLGKISTVLIHREQQLIKSEQVASLGYIASDITYSTGASLDDIYKEFTKSNKPISSDHLKPIIALLENFNQMAADQDEEDTKHFDLVLYVNKIMMLFSTEFKHSSIDYNYCGDEKLFIDSIPSQVAILILNLVNNALKHGFTDCRAGKITIRIEKTSDNKTKLSFKDNGIGMNSNILKQAFIPFFTTKCDRGYVGIGLSTSYNIVKNILCGDIKLASQQDQGTEVTIIF